MKRLYILGAVPQIVWRDSVDDRDQRGGGDTATGGGTGPSLTCRPLAGELRFLPTRPSAGGCQERLLRVGPPRSEVTARGSANGAKATAATHHRMASSPPWKRAGR